jgi:hypothetical protein
MMTTPATRMHYYAGLDLGQAHEFTALAIVEKAVVQERFGAEAAEPTYAVRHLERFPMGTPYAEIFERVVQTVDKPPLDRVRLVVDQTGVGAAVMEMLRAMRDRPWPVSVTISAGLNTESDGCCGWLIPKKDLVGMLQVLLQTRRLKVAGTLPEAGLLVEELMKFKMKPQPVNTSDPLAAWRDGQHDDMVFAVAIAVWQGERELNCGQWYQPMVLGGRR